MKAIFPLTLAAVVSTLLITSSPLRAAGTDSRIESSAAKSYVFKTTLKDDSIKTESKNGIVTLTGTVAEASHKSLAEDTVASLPGVKSVNNKLDIDGVLSTKDVHNVRVGSDKIRRVGVAIHIVSPRIPCAIHFMKNAQDKGIMIGGRIFGKLCEVFVVSA